MTPEQRYPEVDRAEAAQRGISVEQLYRDQGLRMDELDGRWYLPGTNGRGPGQIRFISKEIPGGYEDGDVEWSTEDIRETEIGHRAMADLVIENGDTEQQREYSQVVIRSWAGLARAQAMNRETEHRLSEIGRRIAQLEAGE